MKMNELENSWKMIESAINFYTVGLTLDEIKQLSQRLNVKAEWLASLVKGAEK